MMHLAGIWRPWRLDLCTSAAEGPKPLRESQRFQRFAGLNNFSIKKQGVTNAPKKQANRGMHHDTTKKTRCPKVIRKVIHKNRGQVCTCSQSYMIAAEQENQIPA
ncbi:MAG: hypothetical protein WDA25_05675 [Paracoccaceae bacterium]